MTQSAAEISSVSKGRTPSPPQPQMQGRTRLCHALDIGEGEAKGFGPIDGGRRKIILVRRDGMLHAWLDACPHYSTGTPMAWKTDAYLNGEKTHLTCHSHHALFDMETGECVLGPCLGQSLTRVTITMDDDGQVFVVHAAREE